MIAIFRSTGKFRSGLTAVRVRSGLGTALLSPNCHLGAVLPSVATKRMTIGRLMLVQAVASAAVLQSTAKSPGTFAGGWRPQPFLDDRGAHPRAACSPSRSWADRSDSPTKPPDVRVSAIIPRTSGGPTRARLRQNRSDDLPYFRNHIPDSGRESGNPSRLLASNRIEAQSELS
jgi:hypothetical protein